MRKSCILLVCIGLLVSGLISSVPAEPINEIKISQITYINTDWTVSDTQIRENETIVLTGNLTVEFGGHLTLKNITLIMNSTAGGSSIEEFYHIEVQQGGTMYILDLDNDNTTINDASNITLNDTNAYYWFWVRDGSNVTMKNSELHQCGGWSVNSGGAGLMVYTDNATIDHNLISNNRYGIVLYGSDAIVSNNTIEWNEYGVRATSWSNGTIENNFIGWSGTYGIEVDGWDNTVKRSSNPLIRNNTILESGRGTTVANGIHITYYSNPTIIDNRIINYTEDAIYFGQWCEAIVDNLTIDADGGNYGLASSAPRNVTVTNTSINNTNWWDLSLATAYFKMTNCTFNQSKVIFQGTDSNLTVNWYLHTFVQDNMGNPVSNAYIRIRDNVNGTFDENFTTDVNGYVNWTVLREYFQKDIDGDKDGDDIGERIDYGPYNITVENNGYYTNYTLMEMNQSKYITITLQADEKPIADAGLDQSVNEDEQVTFNASGTSDDVEILWYNWSFGDGSYNNGTNITPNHTYTNAGTYIVTLNVTDTIAQWDTDTCLVFVNNVGPTADAGSGQIVNEGESVLFNGSGSTDTPSDQSDLIYTWHFVDGNSDTGMFVNHSFDDDGSYNATLVVTDDNGFVDSNITIITVNNVAPTIEPVPLQTILEDSPFTLKINASDVPADTLTFSDNTTLFDIDLITGLIEFTPTNDDVGNYSVNITVMDDDGGVNYTIFNITVQNTNDPPVIESIGQQSATEDVEFTLQIDAEDVDVGDVLTYSLIDYPAGMNIDSAGIITWTPTNDDVGTHTITVKVQDIDGLYNKQSFTILVSNVNDAPPIITTSLANATEDVFFMAYIHADDIDAGDTSTYSLDAHPTFISIDPITGQIFGIPTNDNVGTHNVVVNVTDGDAYATKTFTLIVVNVNDAPIIASTPILTTDVGVEYAYDVIASDEDNDVLIYSLIEGPEGMAINGSKITWTPTNEHQGKTYQVVLEVTDGEVSTTQSFIISVGEIPEKTNYWPPLLLGLVGGLISGVIITWLMNQQKKEEEPEDHEVPIERSE